MTTTETLTVAFEKGIFNGYNSAERDAFISVVQLVTGRKPATKAAIDAFVAPLVDDGLLVIERAERLIKGCPGGIARPATTIRTSYALTAKGLAERQAWQRAHPETLTEWQRHVLGV